MTAGANPATRLPRGVDLAVSAWLLFWASLLVVYNHAGAYAYAGLVILLGAAGWLVLLRRTPLRGRALLMGIAWSFLLLWMLASQGWAPPSGEGTVWRLAGQLALMLSLPALIATRGDGARSALSHILMATGIAGAAVMVADVASGYGLSFAIDPPDSREIADLWRRQSDTEMHVGRGLVAWSVLAPTLLALMATRLHGWRRGAAGLAFVGLLVVAAWLNRLMIPLLVLAASLPVFALALKAPTLTGRLSVALASLSILAAPVVGVLARLVPESALARLPLSWDHRLRMWDYALARTLERPLTGHGLDASRAMQESFTTRIGVDIPYISLHPHNVGLQVWMELGAIGAVFAAGAVGVTAFAALRVARRSPHRTAATCALIVGASVAAMVTVGAWQYWWWGLVALAGALIALVPDDAASTPT